MVMEAIFMMLFFGRFYSTELAVSKIMKIFTGCVDCNIVPLFFSTPWSAHRVHHSHHLTNGFII